MCRLHKGSIVSFHYGGVLKIAEITVVRNLQKQPLDYFCYGTENAKYLYTTVDYDGNQGSYFDASMKDVVVLSNGQFCNVGLLKHFSKIKETIAELKRAELAKITSGNHIERLGLANLKEGKIKVVLINGKSKTVRYVGYGNDCNGEFGIVHCVPGIEVNSRIPAKQIHYIVPEYTGELAPVTKVVLADNEAYGDTIVTTTVETIEVEETIEAKECPVFEIPEYEIEQGFSDEFWHHFKLFMSVRDKYGFVLRDGKASKVAQVLDWVRVTKEDHRDVIITLKIEGNGIITDTIKLFKEIVLIEADYYEPFSIDGVNEVIHGDRQDIH